MALTKADLADCVQEEVGLSNAECKELVDEFFGAITDALTKGNEVKLSGFGNFVLHDKNARPGRNPTTGEPVTIAARRVVAFHPGRKLKAKVAPAL